MDLLFTPAKLGTCELKNRIVRSATNEHLSDEKGQVTPLWADTLIELAKNEVGLVITGHFCVDKMQRADAGQPVLDETTDESLLRRACDGVHRYGGKLFFQLSHSGIKGVESVNGAPPKHPEDFTREELDRLVEQFAFAAKKCKESGADGVQVHNAHGYLLSNFLNPEENLRTDEYGGSAENRARFAVEAVRAVRSRLPELPIDYKLAVRQEDPHYGNAGVLESELGIFVPLLVEAGVTSFHVTLANHSSLEDTIPPANHPYFKGEGCFLKFCDEVRQYTDKPITGVGGLTNPDFVEAQLASGRITCAAMSRQLLADPAWPSKAAAGQVQAIHRCVRCNKKCLGGLQQHQGTHCIYEKTGA